MKPKEIKIVFVHLNGQIPRYLKLNLISTAEKFPNNKIVLLSNVKQKWSHQKIEIIVRNDSSWREWGSKLTHPVNFRNNFWFTSIARFFAIEEYLAECPEAILHIESDVILSNKFPLDKFTDGNFNISFPLASTERGVASVFFVKELKALEHFNSFAKKEMQENPSTSDMLILGAYFNSFSEKVQLLPTGPDISEAFKATTPQDIMTRISMSYKYFGGIIDGNDLGMYFFGTDPRNLRGKSIMYKEIESSFFKVNKFSLLNSDESDFPSLRVESSREKFLIFSIHATCKDTNLFNYRSQLSTLLRRSNESHVEIRSRFILQVALSQFIKSLKNRIITLFL